MEDNFEKLNLLLEQEQCEFVDIPDGFTGQTESGELLEKFKQTQRKIRPAVEAMLAEADRVAESKSGGYSLEDVFGTEDEK